jgi:hypothetical protein
MIHNGDVCQKNSNKYIDTRRIIKFLQGLNNPFITDGGKVFSFSAAAAQQKKATVEYTVEKVCKITMHLFYYNFASPPWPKQGSAVVGASAKITININTSA